MENIFRAAFLAIAFFVVRNQLFISPVLTKISDKREFIDFELLVFGGMGIIKDPLFEGDVSAYEVDQQKQIQMLMIIMRKKIISILT